MLINLFKYYEETYNIYYVVGIKQQVEVVGRDTFLSFKKHQGYMLCFYSNILSSDSNNIQLLSGSCILYILCITSRDVFSHQRSQVSGVGVSLITPPLAPSHSLGERNPISCYYGFPPRPGSEQRMVSGSWWIELLEPPKVACCIWDALITTCMRTVLLLSRVRLGGHFAIYASLPPPSPL